MPNIITKQDLAAAVILFILPLMLFAPVTLGSQTLLPVENRFTFEPYQTFANELGVGPPKNHLLSDLILENYIWKGFIREAIAKRQLPLWNPYIFSGQPFLGNGQHSALYPPSIIFYLLPLSKAYGWFTVIQLWLAGLFTYLFLRVLGANWVGALFGGITFGLSTFLVNRVVFTMIIAAVVWLPLVLTAIEMVIRKQEEKGTEAYSPIPYLAFGAVAMGLQVLAGHIEITIHVLLISAIYALARLIIMAREQGTFRPAIRLTAWLMAMMLVGLGLGSIQLIPFYEIGASNFREGSASFAEVQGWALPYRRIISFLIPDFFGSPAHHGFFDLVTKQWQTLGLNAHGEINPLCPNCTRWDTKNAVEAGAYPGLLSLIIAGLLIFQALKKASLPTQVRRLVFIFAGLALLSLLFIFGTPAYALLYYGIPFLNQLHTPFRWIYAFTFSVAILGGLGLTYLTTSRLLTRLAWPLLVGGAGTIIGLIVIFLVPQPFIAAAQFGFDRSGLAQNAFANGQQFLSYLWPHLLAFSGFVLLGGLWLWSANRLSKWRWHWAAIIIIALDLMIANFDFNPATDSEPLTYMPPAIIWLREQQAQYPYFRLTSYEGEGGKIFDTNTPMDLRLFDVRGYDSVIAKQYLDFMQLIQGNGDWLHNRIGPVYNSWAGALDSALLDLLGVRYVLTLNEITNPNYRLVYDAEIKIYENTDVLPRAFLVTQAQTAVNDLGLALQSLNPRETVILDGEFIDSGRDLTSDDALAPALDTQVKITAYENNEVWLEADVVEAGWLVLADSYFPGWKAYVTPKNETDGVDEVDEIEVIIHRANGNFRAIYLPPGQWSVRFVYTPMSFKLGVYASFLAGMMLVLSVAYWLWGKIYREQASDSIIKRIAKNSLAPMVLALLNRMIDFVFALLVLRILAPEGLGRYAFAVSLITFFEIVTRFGLGTLLTREVAKDHAVGNKYLLNTILVRNLFGLIAIPIIAAILAFYYFLDNLTADVVYTMILFTIGMFLSNIADALSALFYAYEKAEYPAFIATMTALARIGVGAFLLLLGFGIVGLGAASVVGNLLSVLILGTILRQKIFKPHRETDRALQREMVGESFPLMINHLLSTIFFRVDVFILKPTWGDQAVGYYNAAYKYVDGINVIPQYFTLAIFPLMSRYASTSRESLIRAYLLSLRLLQMLALPIAVGTPFIAEDLILILGGQAFLPDGAIVLQLLIWFLPFSFINQVTQYVLISIDQQRFLTKAFIIGVTFNIIANLILVPRYGYRAAAITTILSEWSLLIPFYYAVHKNLCAVPWLDIMWRPTVAAIAMGGVLWFLRPWGTLVMLPVGAIVYLVCLGLVGGYRQPDMGLIWAALPTDRLKKLGKLSG